MTGFLFWFILQALNSRKSEIGTIFFHTNLKVAVKATRVQNGTISKNELPAIPRNPSTHQAGVFSRNACAGDTNPFLPNFFRFPVPTPPPTHNPENMQPSQMRKRLVVTKAVTREQMMQLYIHLLLEAVGGEGGGIEEITFNYVNLRHFTKLPPLPCKNNLRTLIISDCHLGLPELCDVLKYSYSLHTLNLSRNQLDDQACTVLAEFLRSDTRQQLCELYLQHNQITQQGAMELFCSLQHNTMLDTLNLESNRIKLNSTTSTGLPEMPNLKMLILACNRLGVQGMQVLAEMLSRTSKRSTLKWLDLSETEAGDEGVSLLAEAMATNRTLEHVMLSGNGLSNKAAEAMAGMLERNTTLLGLDLALNPIGLSGAHSLAQAVLKLVCRTTDIGLDVETQRILLVAIHTAALARKALALRSAMEIKRLGSRSALRRLPRELCFMVASCLVAINKEEEDYDDDEEEEEEVADVNSD